MSSSVPIVKLSLTFAEVEHTATLSTDGHIIYGNSSLGSITEFCNQVTKQKTSGQVTDRIKFIVNGTVKGDYGYFKEKVSDYKYEKLKALYCLLNDLPLPIVQKKEREVVSSSSTIDREDPDIVKQ